MAEKTPAPCGAWPSPVTSELLTTAALSIQSPVFFDDRGRAVWLEGRPAEGGRVVACVARADGSAPVDITPPGFNVRTRVHEYGGGALLVDGAHVYFTNFADQRLYAQTLLPDGDARGVASAPLALTPADGGWRFADFSVDRAARCLVCVAERHPPGATSAEHVENMLAAVRLPPAAAADGAAAAPAAAAAAAEGAAARPPEVLVSGHDFFASPRVAQLDDGRTALCYVFWDHPHMPWDASALAIVVAPAGGGGLADPSGEGRSLAQRGLEAQAVLGGGEGDASTHLEPRWCGGSGRVIFATDRPPSACQTPADGWWQLRTAALGDGAAARGLYSAAAHAQGEDEAEYVRPPWMLGYQHYVALRGAAGSAEPPPVLALRFGCAGEGAELWALAHGGGGRRVHTPFGVLSAVSVLEPPADAPADAPCVVAVVGGRADLPTRVALVALPPLPGGRLDCAALSGLPLDADADADADAEGGGGGGGGATADAAAGPRWVSVRVTSSLKLPRATLSVPRRVSFPVGEGASARTAHMLLYPPTSATHAPLPAEAPPLLVKSHGGPTSAASGAFSPLIQYWTSRGFAVGDVDYSGSTGYGRAYRERLKGRWGEADVQDCAAAARHAAAHGWADARRLCISGGSAGGYTTLACLVFCPGVFAAGASHYGVADLEVLAADTHKFESRYLDSLVGPLPAAAAVYAARSPLRHCERLRTPVAFFQGDEDKVVPPNQATLMHEKVRALGVPTALVMFAGEQHGFRQTVNIRRAIDGEHHF